MIDVYVASAFSKNNKGGNKAGVVFDGSDLTVAHKMSIAKKLGYSETAFVSKSDIADYKLQYFTPTDEVALCGHATIAAFSTLNLLNRLEKDNYTIETKSGILKIQIQENGMIFMEQNCPVYFDVMNTDIFTNCFESHVIDCTLPIQIISTGLKDIMLPVDSKEHLEGLQPNLENITALSIENDVVGIHAFTLTEDSDVTAICRNFAPRYGINEESATGTSCCALAGYLFKYYEKESQYIFEQGYNLREVSRLAVNITYHNNEIDSIFVGGYGYLLCKKAI